jgi:cysteine desulfurase
MNLVYLDHNATTPLDPRVREAMLPWLGERFGNPSSVHRFGQAAREAVEEARATLAALVGGRPEEVVFVASGTEANNTVVAALARAFADRPFHFVLSVLEHASVREAVRREERAGARATWVAPNSQGRLETDEVLAAVGSDTRLVCAMLAQNEIGTLQPVAAIASGCRARAVPVLCDAAQAIGKVPVDVSALGVDYLTLAAHKFYGPLGVGALWVRRGAALESYLVGGGQERRRRAGTENVAGIVGLGKAAEFARTELESRASRLRALRDDLERRLGGLGGFRIHGAESPRLPHTSHFAVEDVMAQDLLIRLDLRGFAVSTGSACAAGAVEPSPVLGAMGLTRDEALASLRVSFGVGNTPGDVAAFCLALAEETRTWRTRMKAVRA